MKHGPFMSCSEINTKPEFKQQTITVSYDYDTNHKTSKNPFIIKKRSSVAEFYPGDRFFIQKGDLTIKYGTVRRLRDDKHEQESWKNGGDYFYSVDFDDGTFDTYVPQQSMIYSPKSRHLPSARK